MRWKVGSINPIWLASISIGIAKIIFCTWLGGSGIGIGIDAYLEVKARGKNL